MRSDCKSEAAEQQYVCSTEFRKGRQSHETEEARRVQHVLRLRVRSVPGEPEVGKAGEQAKHRCGHCGCRSGEEAKLADQLNGVKGQSKAEQGRSGVPSDLAEGSLQ